MFVKELVFKTINLPLGPWCHHQERKTLLSFSPNSVTEQNRLDFISQYQYLCTIHSPSFFRGRVLVHVWAIYFNNNIFMFSVVFQCQCQYWQNFSHKMHKHNYMTALIMKKCMAIKQYNQTHCQVHLNYLKN